MGLPFDCTVRVLRYGAPLFHTMPGRGSGIREPSKGQYDNPLPHSAPAHACWGFPPSRGLTFLIRHRPRGSGGRFQFEIREIEQRRTMILPPAQQRVYSVAAGARHWIAASWLPARQHRFSIRDEHTGPMNQFSSS